MILILYLIFFIAYFKELKCVGLGEEKGFSDQHAEEILEHEGIERRELDVCLELFEGVAVVLHPVGEELPQLEEERRGWLRDWLGDWLGL